jgi:hypothetical protein
VREALGLRLWKGLKSLDFTSSTRRLADELGSSKSSVGNSIPATALDNQMFASAGSAGNASGVYFTFSTKIMRQPLAGGMPKD